jgi:hypothetical protein
MDVHTFSALFDTAAVEVGHIKCFLIITAERGGPVV